MADQTQASFTFCTYENLTPLCKYVRRWSVDSPFWEVFFSLREKLASRRLNSHAFNARRPITTAPVVWISSASISVLRNASRSGYRRLTSPFRSFINPSSDMVVPTITFPMVLFHFLSGFLVTKENDTKGLFEFSP